MLGLMFKLGVFFKLLAIYLLILALLCERIFKNWAMGVLSARHVINEF